MRLDTGGAKAIRKTQSRWWKHGTTGVTKGARNANEALKEAYEELKECMAKRISSQ